MFLNPAFLKGGDLNPGERHSRDTRDDVTLCTLRAATVLSRDCPADFGRPLTKKVMSHSRDGQTLYLSLGNGRNTVSRVLFRRGELTEFYGKLGEFFERLGEFALAHK